MGEPPEELDGARVLTFAVLDESIVPTGRTRHEVGGELMGPATGLVIAQFHGNGGFYLYYCDSDWQVVTDTYHDSMVAAQEQAEYEYRGVSARWRTR